MRKFTSNSKQSKLCGIYKIYNKTNNKSYVGSSKCIEYRFYEHRKNLRKNKHVNNHLQNSWNKNGENSFSFETIEECEECELLKKEQIWVEKLKSSNRKHGYNICEVVDRPTMSEEVRKKISDTLKGNTPWNLGKHHSEEAKKKMRERKKGICGKSHPRYGKSHSEETKKKISESNKKYCGELHNCYGKHRSEETKDKLRKSQSKNAKPVLQILEGAIVKRYESISQAKKETNIKTISRCARGKQLSAGGYQWEFE